ncbi:MAG: UTP--glucose-1-phosphate uridylyltransferase [Planctomycetales bacterium]|nr:UTP--glucose-1-phosphate uridylyltransferase [Planctomycetales bacterium]
MSVQVAVIPVAGRGTRLLPLTKCQPKEMLPLGRKPTVQHVVEELTASGIREMLFVTGPGKTAIENHFDIDVELIEHLRVTGKEDLLAELDFEREEIDYFYTRQRRQLGLGHAILCARPFVGDRPFLVALGDSLIGLNHESDVCRRMIDCFEETAADAVIAFQEVPRDEVEQYGIALPKGEAGDIFDLDDLIEKPSRDEAPSNLAVAARYVCRPSIFQELSQTQPGKGGEIQLTDAFRHVLAQGGRIVGLRLRPGEKRYDVGNFESYFNAFLECALADPEYGDQLRESLRKLL